MISTHALREEGDMVRCTLRETVFNFYPRPPRGGRLQRCSVAADVILFLPTPSARRATSAGLWKDSPHKVISTHALREEGDIDFLEDAIKEDLISTHALREEGDQGLSYEAVSRDIFLPTPSARRATSSRSPAAGRGTNFYPRPPRGGRPGQGVGHVRNFPFLPTPSARRATRWAPACACAECISTHALREEGDAARPGRAQHDGISTHALREEGDPSLCGSGRSRSTNFYPRPPRGGRPRACGPRDTGKKFLPTPSARRATARAPSLDGWTRFLPTPSARRATPRPRWRSAVRTFLPTPSARRATAQGNPFRLGLHISTHALREEGDAGQALPPLHLSDFYPRPPRGGRL